VTGWAREEGGPVHRWSGADDVPPGALGDSVVTVGVFDGVHRGHRSVVGRAVERARREGRAAVAVTFDPHPTAVLRPERAPRLLSTLDHRLELLAGLGLDATLVLRFTPDLAALPPERFAADVLGALLHARAVVVGADFRFGARAAGDVALLAALGRAARERGEPGWEVEAVPPVHAPGGARWSSTWVRERVAEGDVSAAAAALGRPHRLEGVVVRGDQRGRDLGYPTANVDVPATSAVPADGVYAGWLERRHACADGAGTRERLPAAVSIGTNPTFDGVERRVEAHVLDRDDLALYGEHVAVDLVERLRPMERFGDIGALRAQMAHDVERTRAITAGPAVTGSLGLAGPPA
jgi:riboflavin kinase/FMN adenylyltransferase